MKRLFLAVPAIAALALAGWASSNPHRSATWHAQMPLVSIKAVIKAPSGRITAHRQTPWDDLVTTNGCSVLLQDTLNNAAIGTTWYIGEIKGTNPTFAIGDTPASHGGWTGFASSDVTNANLLTLSFTGTPSGTATVTWTGNAVTYTQNSSITLSGAYIIDQLTFANQGVNGNLYSEGSFQAAAVAAGYTATFTPTFTIPAG